jgi:hypothetical protein
MKKLFFPLIAIVTLVTACQKKEINPFLVSKQSVGLLTDSTTVSALDAIYATDSIIKKIAGDEFTGRINAIEIYEKGGKKLLELSPSQALDSTATISNIKIFDDRFKTKKGININSTFGDLKANYTISSIQNTLRNIVIFINEDNTYYTIDKKELPAELRFDVSKKIEAIQIPETAKIKFFMLDW